MHLRAFQASLALLRISALLPGELGAFDAFCGVLTCSDMFFWHSQIAHSSRRLGACIQRVRLVPGPFCSPLCDTAPLACKPGVTDTFPAVFEPSTSPYAWLLSSFCRSACCLGLPVGESGSSGSIGRILTCLCMTLAIFACIASPCVSMHMFSMPK